MIHIDINITRCIPFQRDVATLGRHVNQSVTHCRHDVGITNRQCIADMRQACCRFQSSLVNNAAVERFDKFRWYLTRLAIMSIVIIPLLIGDLQMYFSDRAWLATLLICSRFIADLTVPICPSDIGNMLPIRLRVSP